MLQVRLREGSDKRWFNPGRDMVQVWPMMLRKTLQSFDTFEGNERCSREQLVNTASKWGMAVARAIKEPVDHEMASKELLEIEAECPEAFSMISRVAMHAFHGVYVAWLADAKPKCESDSDIPIVGLDQIAEKISRGAQKPQ